MKSRKMFCVMAVVLAVFAVSGCTTTPKKVKEEVTGIKTRVDTLESRVESVESKQIDVERMTAEQAQAIEELKTQRETVMPKSNISVKDRTSGTGSDRIRGIQTSLKNAGFYKGSIDGIKGKATRQAIVDFQQANGLKADGVVGPKTQEVLDRYQYGPAAAGNEGADIK